MGYLTQFAGCSARRNEFLTWPGKLSLDNLFASQLPTVGMNPRQNLRSSSDHICFEGFENGFIYEQSPLSRGPLSMIRIEDAQYSTPAFTNRSSMVDSCVGAVNLRSKFILRHSYSFPHPTSSSRDRHRSFIAHAPRAHRSLVFAKCGPC